MSYPHCSYEIPALDYIQKPFQTLDIYAWSPQDCVEWANSVCRRRGLDQNAVDLCAFRNASGTILLQFSLQDFCTLVGDDIGRVFYQDFRAQIKRRRASYVEHPREEYPSSYSANPYAAQDADTWTFTQYDIQDLDQYIRGDGQDQNQQNYEQQTHIMDRHYWDQSAFEGLIDNSFGQLMEAPSGEPGGPPLEASPPGAIGGTGGTDGAGGYCDEDSMSSLLYPITSRRKRTRGPKVWEFLVRLLLDPSTNPSLIAWEDMEAGTFRLVEKEKIAALWIKRSGGGSLSYSNFARTIRHHYGTGNIVPTVRQLVFGLGAAAREYLHKLQQNPEGMKTQALNEL